jgi:hypothetical protein
MTLRRAILKNCRGGMQVMMIKGVVRRNTDPSSTAVVVDTLVVSD